LVSIDPLRTEKNKAEHFVRAELTEQVVPPVEPSMLEQGAVMQKLDARIAAQEKELRAKAKLLAVHAAALPLGEEFKTQDFSRPHPYVSVIMDDGTTRRMPVSDELAAIIRPFWSALENCRVDPKGGS
jgi:hypothetical protein